MRLLVFFLAFHSVLYAQNSMHTGIYECRLNDSTISYLVVSDNDASFSIRKYTSGRIEVFVKSVIHWDTYEIIVSPPCTLDKTDSVIVSNVQSRLLSCGPYINTRYVWAKNYTELIMYEGKKKTKQRYHCIAPGITFKSVSEVEAYFK